MAFIVTHICVCQELYYISWWFDSFCTVSVCMWPVIAVLSPLLSVNQSWVLCIDTMLQLETWHNIHIKFWSCLQPSTTDKISQGGKQFVGSIQVTNVIILCFNLLWGRITDRYIIVLGYRLEWTHLAIRSHNTGSNNITLCRKNFIPWRTWRWCPSVRVQRCYLTF